MTVDEILATGRYRDRKGRPWMEARLSRRWETLTRVDPNWGPEYLSISRPQMRLLIERDQHVCQGLRRCLDHPVPHVLIAEWEHDRFEGFMVYPAGNEFVVEECDFHNDAMSAARALAVGE